MIEYLQLLITNWLLNPSNWGF